jgi:GNAT superfamily N-acetyltransferase
MSEETRRPCRGNGRPSDTGQARLPDGVSLRAAVEDDEPFLRELYESTREEELAIVPWSEQQKRDFLDFQFFAQRAHYLKHHPQASHDLILCAGAPAGRLYVERTAREILVVDVALLPAHRGRGIATALLRELLDEARSGVREIVIHVERMNRARVLYERLGFAVVQDLGAYLRMAWDPRDARDAGR